MFTKKFWKAAVERAVKTFAQTFLAGVGVQALPSVHLPYGPIALGAAIAAGLSVLTSIVSANVGPSDSPSLVADSGYTLIEMCFALVLLVIAIILLFHFVH